MKKFVFIMPLMAISLLASCGGSKEPTKVSYTLTYTYNNGSEDKYVETYAEDKKTVKPTWVPEYSGYTFDGWFTKSGTEGTQFTFGNILTTDTVVFAHWTEKPTPETTYTITFKNNGDEDKKIENIQAGSIITENIPDPSPRQGSTFIGWCTDTESKNVFDFSKIKIYQDYTLYSGWKEDKPATYDVIFYAGEGSYNEEKFVWLKNIPSGTKILSLLKAQDHPTLDGSTFAYYEYVGKNSAIDYDDEVTSAVMLQAHYFLSSAPKSDDLTEFDWKTIKNIAVTGDPSLWFNIGATKKVEVNQKDHDVRIIDFNHDELTTSTKENPKYASITFEFANVITKEDGGTDTTGWSNEDDDNYKYSKSALNNYLNVGNDSIFNRLPDDLKTPGVIAEVYKPVAETENYEINTTYTTRLFPLSYREITANGQHEAAKEEGTTYAFYTGSGDNQDNRIKKAVDGDAQIYWLRSPYTQWEFSAWYIQETGLIHFEDVETKIGVTPAFCI